jgi:3-oxoacyl-[acyl-carrier-protein] synthase-3
VHKIAQAIEAAVEKSNLTIEDIDWFIPHQANQRILNGVAERLGLDEHKVISTVALHANTSAASIPLAWYEGVKDGRIKPGDVVLIEALGGGLTWGAAAIRL